MNEEKWIRAMENGRIENLPAAADEDENEIRAIIETVSELEIPSGMATKDAWEKMKRRIESEEKIKPIKRRIQFWKWSAAAVILLIIGISVIQQSGVKNFQTEFSQRKTIELPDGSRVFLDDGTSVSYSSFLWKWDREVNLTGRAFFEVIPGSSFTVNTSLGEVEVLGTSFSVEEWKENFIVYCASGSVLVKAHDQEKVIKAGEGSKLSGNSLVVFNADPENGLAWKEGRYIFEDEPLYDVLEVMSMHYDLKFEGDIPFEHRFTGEFHRNNLNEALEIVLGPSGTSYEIHGNTVRLKKQ